MGEVKKQDRRFVEENNARTRCGLDDTYAIKRDDRTGLRKGEYDGGEEIGDTSRVKKKEDRLRCSQEVWLREEEEKGKDDGAEDSGRKVKGPCASALITTYQCVW